MTNHSTCPTCHRSQPGPWVELPAGASLPPSVMHRIEEDGFAAEIDSGQGLTAKQIGNVVRRGWRVLMVEEGS